MRYVNDTNRKVNAIKDFQLQILTSNSMYLFIVLFIYSCVIFFFNNLACLKLNVRNCGDVLNVDAFMHKIPIREHLQIAKTQMRPRQGPALFAM